jgi:hypothetical protein
MRLKKKNIPFNTEIADDATIDRYRDEGHASFPIVRVEFGDRDPLVWSGFRLTEIDRLADLIG